MNINDYIIQTWLQFKATSEGIFNNITSELKEILVNFNYEKLIEVIGNEVKKAESKHTDKEGFDKKEIVLISVCSAYDLFDEKYKLPDIVDSITKEKIIPTLIDLVVEYLNKNDLWGKN